MVDLRKLVSGFLVLAALSSFAVFIFSTTGIGGGNQTNGDASKNLDLSAGQISQISKNAFVEALPQSADSNNQPDAGASLQVLPSSNLTQNLSQNMALEVLKANPNGPQDAGDSFSMETLDEATLEKTTVMSIDDLGLSEKYPKKDLKIIEDNSDKAVLAYIDGINAVFKKTVGSDEFRNLPNQELSMEMVSAAQVVFDQAVREASNLPVPLKLSDLHQEIVTGFANNKKIFDAIQDYENDPLKSMLALQSANLIIERDQKHFQAEFEKVSFPKDTKLGMSENKSVAALFYNLVSVPQAHAQLFVPTDCMGPSCTLFQKIMSSTSVKDLLQKLFEWAKKLATEQLKDTLIRMMVQQTTNWIQNGAKGKPQFVENWKGFLQKTWDQAAGATIQREVPQLCQSFGPIVKFALIPDVYVGSGRYSRCTLSTVRGGLDRFYNRFEDGDWVTYAQSLNSYGNVWGSVIETHDKAITDAVSAKEAAQARTVAAQGANAGTGTKEKDCSAIEVHNVSEYWNYYAGPPAPGWAGTEAEARFIADSINQDYIERTFKSGSGDFQTCPANAWKDTTPGGAIAHALYTSLDAPLHRIVNAQDLIGLVTALVDSGLNRLIRAGSDGLNSLFTKDEPSAGKYDSSSLCAGLTGSALSECLSKGLDPTLNIVNTSKATSSAAVTGCDPSSPDYATCVASSTPPGGPGATNLPPAFTSIANTPACGVGSTASTCYITLSAFTTPTWTVTAQDPEGQPLTYEFDWGDASAITSKYAGSGTSVSASHVYGCSSFFGASCPYTLTIRVGDGWPGNTITKTINLVVHY